MLGALLSMVRELKHSNKSTLDQTYRGPQQLKTLEPKMGPRRPPTKAQNQKDNKRKLTTCPFSYHWYDREGYWHPIMTSRVRNADSLNKSAASVHELWKLWR